MSDYKRIATSQEVYGAIRNQHPELKIFGSYSAPDGDKYGNPGRGKMFTSYGFYGEDSPIIEAQYTWDVDRERPYERENLKHEYWLCIPKRQEWEPSFHGNDV